MEFGNQSGIDKYLFGQVVGLSSSDLWTMAFSFLLILMLSVLLYKELLVAGFDSEFARSIGLPVDFLQYALWLLLAFAVITSLQVVGVVWFPRLLIIPAATASLITDKMKAMLIWSALLGCWQGQSGHFYRFSATNCRPVRSSSWHRLLFSFDTFFAPSKRPVFQMARRPKQKPKNCLGEHPESGLPGTRILDFQKDIISVGQLAKRRRTSMPQAHREVNVLFAKQYATLHSAKVEKSAPLKTDHAVLDAQGLGKGLPNRKESSTLGIVPHECSLRSGSHA